MDTMGVGGIHGSAGNVVGVFSARLTNARFLGDVSVGRLPGQLALHGPRASSSLYRARLVAQWSLAALGVVGLAANAPALALGCFVASALVSLGGYFVLWWFARDETLVILDDDVRGPLMGWSRRFDDIYWMGGTFSMIDRAYKPWIAVSFRTPASDGSEMTVILQTREARDAIRLAGLLIDGE